MEEELVGRIEHFFDRISVAVVKLGKPLKVGDHLHINGDKTDFEQMLREMQSDRKGVDKARKGDSVGLRLEKPAKEGDLVYRVTES
jgi:hypothetical protein